MKVIEIKPNETIKIKSSGKYSQSMMAKSEDDGIIIFWRK